ncbi:hypothetical protein, partial [Metallibacterium sp.]
MTFSLRLISVAPCDCVKTASTHPCGVAPARPSMAVRSCPRELLSAAVRKRGHSPPLGAQNDYGFTHDVLASTHQRRTVRLRENRFD